MIIGAKLCRKYINMFENLEDKTNLTTTHISSASIYDCLDAPTDDHLEYLNFCYD